MTSEELAAIRRRNREDYVSCFEHSSADHDSVFLCLVCDKQRFADIDALLAEVARIIECPCGRHHSLITGSPIEQRRDPRDIG